MKRLFRPAELLDVIVPPQGGLDFLSCRRLELGGGGAVVHVESGQEEVVLVCIAGSVDYDLGGVLAGAAECKDMLYLPRGNAATLSTAGSAVVMRIGAPSSHDTACAHIRFSEIAGSKRHSVFGSASDNSLRDVYMYIDDSFDAQRLLVGIGQGRPGGWTVWPPHEHGDEKEELYVYFDMDGGFGIQCLYESLDDASCFLVREGDAVAVPRGFHPNAGCPGGRISYVYAMAARNPGERSFMALRFQEEFGDAF